MIFTLHSHVQTRAGRFPSCAFTHIPWQCGDRWSDATLTDAQHHETADRKGDGPWPDASSRRHLLLLSGKTRQEDVGFHCYCSFMYTVCVYLCIYFLSFFIMFVRQGMFCVSSLQHSTFGFASFNISGIVGTCDRGLIDFLCLPSLCWSAGVQSSCQHCWKQLLMVLHRVVV